MIWQVWSQTGQLEQYTERLWHFLNGNGIENAARKLSTYLSVIAPITYKLFTNPIAQTSQAKKAATTYNLEKKVQIFLFTLSKLWWRSSFVMFHLVCLCSKCSLFSPTYIKDLMLSLMLSLILSIKYISITYLTSSSNRVTLNSYSILQSRGNNNNVRKGMAILFECICCVHFSSVNV